MSQAGLFDPSAAVAAVEAAQKAAEKRPRKRGGAKLGPPPILEPRDRPEADRERLAALHSQAHNRGEELARELRRVRESCGPIAALLDAASEVLACDSPETWAALERALPAACSRVGELAAELQGAGALLGEGPSARPEVSRRRALLGTLTILVDRLALDLAFVRRSVGGGRSGTETWGGERPQG